MLLSYIQDEPQMIDWGFHTLAKKSHNFLKSCRTEAGPFVEADGCKKKPARKNATMQKS